MASLLFEAIRNAANESFWDWHSFQIICKYVDYVRLPLFERSVYRIRHAWAVSPDKTFLATGYNEGKVSIRRLQFPFKEIVFKFPEYSGYTYGMSFSFNSKFLAAFNFDSIIVYDIPNKCIFRSFTIDHSILNSQIAFCGISKSLLGCATTVFGAKTEKTIQLWDLTKPGKKPFKIINASDFRGVVGSLKFSEDEKYVAIRECDYFAEKICVWNIEDSKFVTSLGRNQMDKNIPWKQFDDRPFFDLQPSHPWKGILNIHTYSPDGKYGMESVGRLRIWNVKSQTLLSEILKNRTGFRWKALFSPTGKSFAIFDIHDRFTWIFDSKTGKLLFDIPYSTPVVFLNDRVLYMSWRKLIYLVQLWKFF